MLGDQVGAGIEGVPARALERNDALESRRSLVEELRPRRRAKGEAPKVVERGLCLAAHCARLLPPNIRDGRDRRPDAGSGHGHFDPSHRFDPSPRDPRRRRRLRADLLRRVRIHRRAPPAPGRARLARVHPLHGGSDARTRRVRLLRVLARGRGRRLRVRRRARADRGGRPGGGGPRGPGRRRGAAADGGGGGALAFAWSRGHPARPARLPLPVAGAVREARLRRARAVVGGAGDGAGGRAGGRGGAAGGGPRRGGVGRALRGGRGGGPDGVEACAALCERVHGHARSGELRAAVADGTARVVRGKGRLTGYATGFGYGWHAVAEANDDLIALLGSAEAFMGLGVLVPSRNATLLRWCLEHGLRIVQQSTLMTIGLYHEPAGAWLPSIAY